MNNCKCSMAISVNGDGCRYCQPQEYIDKLAEWLEESRADYAALEAECDAALAECERLRELLSHASKAESRPEFMQIIDAALSAKPTEG